MGVKIAEDADEQIERIEHDPAEHKKLKERRATKQPAEGDQILEMLKKQKGKQLKVFKANPRWWTKQSYVYAFSHPHVRSRLEKLMGSNLVRLTDREYMQNLQERILEDYNECMEKRIKVREEDEMERVKNLVLSGKIPLSKAPHSMWDHPVMVIERYCNKLIAERRAKIKQPKTIIPTYVYYDDTPDPPSGLSIEKGHVFRPGVDKLCHPFERFLPEEEEVTHGSHNDAMIEDDSVNQSMNPVANLAFVGPEGGEDAEEEEVEPVLDDYMYTRAELVKLRYEDPLIKKLRRCKTVEQMYALAEEIVGVIDGEDAQPELADPDSISIATFATAKSIDGPSAAADDDDDDD